MGRNVRARGAVAAVVGAMTLAAATAVAVNIEPDPTFGGDGIVKVNGPASAADDASDVAVLADGKVLVAGRMHTAAGGSDFALVRLNANGSRDTTFGGGDGIVTTDIDGAASADRAFGMAVQADGKVVLAGWSIANSPGADRDLAVVRYESDGTLDDDDAEDDGFGEDGIVSGVVSSTAEDWAEDVLVDDSGRVVVAGSVWEGDTVEEFEQDFLVVRLTPAGALDTAFEGDGGTGGGIVRVSFGQDDWAFEEAYGIDLMDDGDLVAAGNVYTGDTTPDDLIGLARLNSADGTLDTSFGGDGKVTTDHPESAFANEVETSADKVTVVGAVGSELLLARYDQSDGDLDASFGDAGTVTTPASAFGGTQVDGTDLAVDGAHYVVSATLSGMPTGEDLAVARYSGTGQLDQDFGGDGTVTASTAPTAGFERAFAVAFVDDSEAQTLNKVIAAGETTRDEPETLDMVVARFRPDETAPTTTIRKPRQGRTRDRTPTLRFTVDEPATSRCRIDSKPWIENCESPHPFGRQSLGRHVIRVQSTDADDNVETPPASRRFRIVR